MKSFKYILIYTVLFILSFACTTEEVEEYNPTIIEFIIECGWCSGKEYIKVLRTKIDYELQIPCGDNIGFKEKSKNLSPDQWNEILDSYEFSTFKNISINECHGCDEEISISQDKELHVIRYEIEKNIAGIEDLQKILNKLLIELREQN
ncbi:MAG: hypothetical protein HQ541_22580 [Mariniphaga sp.]|nr:hypothetical protein [Mariniphaga sp.]